MPSGMHRRDFLKLAGLLPLSLAAPRWPRRFSGAGGQQNVIVVVFDAFSAANISLYGYERDTTPNLKRVAKRAIVYHNHYAGSNFTTSGTASLLTGTLPWTHRAILKNGQVAAPFVSRTIFDVFDDYHRIAYTHNEWAFTLLNQFRSEIDELVAREKLFLKSYDRFVDALFRNDADIASVSWSRDMKLEGGYAYSLFLSRLHGMIQNRQVGRLDALFAHGLPASGIGPFLLEEAMDWVASTLGLIPRPFFGYFHFLPPHAPYTTPLEFADRFKDDWYTVRLRSPTTFSPVRCTPNFCPNIAPNMTNSSYTSTGNSAVYSMSSRVQGCSTTRGWYSHQITAKCSSAASWATARKHSTSRWSAFRC